MFPHTFEPSDVTVLLERIFPEYLSTEERAVRIASGAHYNEVISREAIPDPYYIDLFKSQVERFGDKLASLFVTLSSIILTSAQERDVKPVLVSLVRAGTPTGVLVKRTLDFWGLHTPHYTVSIVQGRGFDEVAIAHILAQGYKPEQLYFIDGWTGKGVVRNELSFALKKLGNRYGAFHDELYVLCDIAGVAEHAATREDCLISSALLSGPLSGLVSRSIYQAEPRMHGAAYLDYMEGHDLSRYFVDAIDKRIYAQIKSSDARLHQIGTPEQAQLKMVGFMTMVEERIGITNPVRLKPGIGESTRLFLRRTPQALIVKDPEDPEVEHLMVLAQEKQVPIVIWSDMTLKACAVTP